MRSVSLAQIAEVTDGALEGPTALRIKGIAIDSRNTEKGDAFVALPGERYDGHAFIEEAARSGAAAVASRGNRNLLAFRKRNPSFPLVLVEDTLEALGDIAGFVRGDLDLDVIGITGTTGKTCTKDFLVSILTKEYRVCYPPGSYNNEVGVPLTVFRADKRDRAMVVEMGARKPGDIRRLAEITRPVIGIITNIGPGHLQLFGDRRAVARAKAELARALPENGALLLNGADEWSKMIAGLTDARVYKYGVSRNYAYRATDIRVDAEGRPTFRLTGPGFSREVRMSVAGRHMVSNAAAAAACAHVYGVSPDIIVEGLGSADVSPWRTEVTVAAGGFTVINDAYNANPHSMHAAIETLREVAGGRRTLAVLGPMAELGDSCRAYHFEAGEHLVRRDVDILVAVGEGTGAYIEAACGLGLPKGSAFKMAGIDEAIDVLRAVVEPGDIILVKASRAYGLDRVARELLTNGFSTERTVNDV